LPKDLLPPKRGVKENPSQGVKSEFGDRGAVQKEAIGTIYSTTSNFPMGEIGGD